MNNAVLFISCAKLNNDFYCSTFAHGYTIKIDLNTGVCHLVGGAVPNISQKWGLVLGYAYWNGAVYFVDASYKQIARYELHTKKTDYIEWNGRHCSDMSPNICYVASYKDRMFIFPRFDGIVSVVNMSDNKLENEISILHKVSYEYIEEKRHTVLGEETIPIPLISAVVKKDDSIYVFSSFSDSVTYLSMIDYSVKEIPFDWNGKDIIDAAFSQGKFYILDSCGDVYIWIKNNTRVKLFIKSDQNEGYYYSRILPTDENIWILPGWGENIRKIDLGNGRDTIYDSFPEKFEYIKADRYRAKYAYGFDDDQKYYLSSFAANYLLTIDKNSGKEQWLRPHGIEKKDVKQFIIDNHVMKCLENELFDLDTFLDVAKLESNEKVIDSRADYGKYIWEKISSM